MKRRSVACAVLAASVTLATYAGATSSAASTSGGEEHRGGRLTIAQITDVISFDVAGQKPGSENLIYALWDPLLKMDTATGELQPWLAESWSFNDESTELTVTLRQGVMLHDGTEMTSANILDMAELKLRDENAPTFSAVFKWIDEIEVVDDYTVVFKLLEPRPAFLEMLDQFFIQGRGEYEELIRNPIGTGPFVFKSFSPGHEIVLERNENYWRDGEPYLDELVFRIMPNLQASLAALETGEVDVMPTPPWPNLVAIEANPDLELIKGEHAWATQFTAFNVEREPYDDVRVRRAINFAFDRQFVADTFFFGYAFPMCLPWVHPQAIAATSQEVVDECAAGQDLEQAAALFEEAGVEDLVIDFMHWPGGRAVAHTEFAEKLKEDLATIGVTVEIRGMESGPGRDAMFAKDFDMLGHSNGAIDRDPSIAMTSAGTWSPDPARATGGYFTEEYVEITDRVASEADPVAREAAIAELMQFTYDEMWAPPIVGFPYTMAFRSDIEGIELTFGMWPDFGRAYRVG